MIQSCDVTIDGGMEKGGCWTKLGDRLDAYRLMNNIIPYTYLFAIVETSARTAASDITP